MASEMVPVPRTLLALRHHLSRNVGGALLHVWMVLAVLAGTARAEQTQVANFPTFSGGQASSQLTLGGVATVLPSGDLQLTIDQQNQVGYTILSTPVDISQGFSTQFTASFLSGRCNLAADGISFVMTTTNTMAREDAGGSYMGNGFPHPYVVPVAITTYLWADPLGDGLDMRASATDLNPDNGLPNFNWVYAYGVNNQLSGADGSKWYFWVDYRVDTGSTPQLAVYYSTSSTKPSTPAMLKAFDIGNHLGTTTRVWLALTGGTGYYCQKNILHNWNLLTGPPPTPAPTAALPAFRFRNTFPGGVLNYLALEPSGTTLPNYWIIARYGNRWLEVTCDPGFDSIFPIGVTNVTCVAVPQNVLGQTGIYRFQAVITLDVDECKTSPNPCGQHAICTNTRGSYDCACEPNYEAPREGEIQLTGCVPINACKEKNGGCSNYAQCIFTGPNTRNCTCISSLAVGDGVSPESGGSGCQYNFTGFFQPVDNLPAVNKVKAGSKVQVKFSLGGNVGAKVFRSGYPDNGPTYPNFVPVDCTAQAPKGALVGNNVRLTAGFLAHDKVSRQYKYEWVTPSTNQGANPGDCVVLQVMFDDDGPVRQAKFQWK